MRLHKLRWLPAAVVALTVFSACEELGVELPEATSIQVVPATLTLFVGQTATVDAQVLDQDSTVMPAASESWSSANPAIASVTPTGFVTANTAGTTTLTATHGGVSGTVEVTVVNASAVTVTPSAVQLVAGNQQQVNASVTGESGEPVTTNVTWQSLNTTVATVNLNGSIGTITAQNVGTTQVVATALGATDTVDVTVVADEAGLTEFFEIAEDTVRTDVNVANEPVVAFEARDGNGNAVCFPGFSVTGNLQIATGVQVGQPCQITIFPQAQGETMLFFTVRPGVVDSVFVIVTAAGVAADFTTEPEPETIVAGDTVTYTVQITNAETGAPIEGATVSFDVDRGSVAAATVVTDANGEASVEWRLPTAVGDGDVDIMFTATTPDGLTTGTVGPFTETILPGPAVRFQLFNIADEEIPMSLAATIGEFETVVLQGYDQFDNEVDTDPAISFTNPDIVEVNEFDGGSTILLDIDARRIGATSLIFAQGQVTDTLAVTVSAGPQVVFTTTFDNTVRVSQITSGADEVTVKNDNGDPVAFPTYTETRDTVGFMVMENIDPDGAGALPAAMLWHPVRAAADGTQAAAPVTTVIPDSLATATQWGFPVFNGSGTVFFLSDTESGVVGAWNLYSATRAGVVTQITTNTSADSVYAGLSISADGGTILYVVAQDADSVASNVVAVSADGSATTTLTSNTDFSGTGAEYVYANYGPSGEIYIQRSFGGVDDLLVLRNGSFQILKENVGFDLVEPSFNPNDPNVMAFMNVNEFADRIFFVDISDEDAVEQVGLDDVEDFSWSKR